jgi:glycosyltransferase involved in cell wall biosynthesis
LDSTHLCEVEILEIVARPRILHLIARMNMGGTATYMANLLEGMSHGPFENLLVIGSVPQGEVEDPVVKHLHVQRISELSREISVADVSARRKFKGIVAEFRPDLIHSHTFKAGVIARSIAFDCPRVHTFHGHHLYDPEFGRLTVGVMNLIEQRLAKRTDRFISVGERVRDELVGVGIGSRESFRSIPPGIQSITLSARRAVLSQLRLSEERPVIVWLGRFTEVKRPDRVVDLARSLPQIQFVMAGGGELEESIKRVEPPNLHCVGWRSKEDMWAIADVGLCTSDSEGMPLALIEAQMAGVPVVSTDVGSVSEIVADGITGRLVPRSGEGMAEAITEIVEMTMESDVMQTNARDRAERLFSVKSMVDAHETLYAQLLR